MVGSDVESGGRVATDGPSYEVESGGNDGGLMKLECMGVGGNGAGGGRLGRSPGGGSSGKSIGAAWLCSCGGRLVVGGTASDCC